MPGCGPGAHAPGEAPGRSTSGQGAPTARSLGTACRVVKPPGSIFGEWSVLTRHVAFALAPHGIAVNRVVPGAIAERPGATVGPEVAADARTHLPFGRIGRAEDIAAAVLFFCLPESEFATGQSLLVDGAHDTYLPEF